MKRLFYLPLAVLTTAFVILCVHHGTAWPWNTVVHEDGRRTLLETIFYFDHALGELPLDLLLSAAVAGAAIAFRTRLTGLGGAPDPGPGDGGMLRSLVVSR